MSCASDKSISPSTTCLRLVPYTPAWLEAAMRGRDGGEPADGLICRRLIYDPSEWQIEEDEAISRMKAEELDRLVAAGRIGEIDREHARFIVRSPRSSS